MSEEDLVRVELVNFPVALAGRFNSHYDALRRELALVRFSDDATRAALPARLVDVAGRATQELGEAQVLDRDQLEADVSDGASTVTIEALVPRGAQDTVRSLHALLVEADELSRAGDLISVAMPPDCCAFRDWVLGEVVAQLSGASSRPWDGATD